MYQTGLINYSQMKLAAVNITIIEFSSQRITFTNIPVQIDVGITEETCLIAVAECLCIFKEFCYQGKSREL
jgi:hypothetical protein